MLKQRLAAVHAVESTFKPAEIAIDFAAIEASYAVYSFLLARRDANLPLNTGLDALTKMQRASDLAIAARREMLEAHPLLDATAKSIGISPAMFGKQEPPTEMTISPAAVPAGEPAEDRTKADAGG